MFSTIAHLPYLIPGGPTTRTSVPLRMTYDEGTVLYDSFRITCGEVMYRDFFEFHGPAFYYAHAALFAITGPSLTAARALNIFLTALSTTLVALLVARILGLTAGAGAAAVRVCLLVPMWPYAYPHWMAEAFALLGIHLLSGNNNRTLRELMGGACLGLSAATIQSLGLPVLAACMAAMAMPGIVQRSWRETCIRPLRALSGASISVIPFTLYLGAVGALSEAWYSMFEWVFSHYSQGQWDIATMGYGAHLTSHIIEHLRTARPWRDLAVNVVWLIMILPAFAVAGGIIAAVRAAIGVWQRSLADADYAHLLIGLASLSACLPLVLGISRADLTHLAFVSSFGLCGAAIAFSPFVRRRPFLRLPLAIAWAIVGVLVIVNFTAKTIMTYPSSRKMGDWRSEVLKLPMARWIDANVGPRDRIVVAKMGGFQYLYIRRCAVGFTYVPDSPRYFSDEQWQKLGDQILKALPPVIQLTEQQWQQITKRTPALEPLYRRSEPLLLRVGFSPNR